MIFCDLGVNPTPWGFSVYEDLTLKLISRGIPASEIAAVGEADSDAKKQSLFERVRQGSVRVLIGSTAKMGTGTNVQKRLFALHHLDAPWRPADVEQRDGRILRRGNSYDEVSIFRYVTEGSFDAYIWQALETKARFIAQVITGESAVRKAEDIAGGEELSYAEVKAIASGNPAVLVLAKAEAELQRLAILRKNHADDQYMARKALRELPQTIGRLAKRVKDLADDLQTLAAHPDRKISFDGQSLPEEDAQKALAKRLQALPQRLNERRTLPLGVFRGLRFGLVYHATGRREVYLEGKMTREEPLFRDAGARAILNALTRLSESYEAQVATTRRELEIAQGQLRDYEPRVGRAFPYETYTAQLSQKCHELRRALSENQEGQRPATEIAQDIEHLKATSFVEPFSDDLKPTAKRRERLERPVTARVREHLGPALKEENSELEPGATEVKEQPAREKSQILSLSKTLHEVRIPIMKPRPRKEYQRHYQVQRRLF